MQKNRKNLITGPKFATFNMIRAKKKIENKIFVDLIMQYIKYQEPITRKIGTSQTV